MGPDMEEDKIVARERLLQRQLRDGESIDELARDLKKLLDLATPGITCCCKGFRTAFSPH